MEYGFADNGWAVHIHTPVQEIQDEDILVINKFLITNVAVFWKKQNLTLKDQSDFCKRFGNLQTFYDKNENWDDINVRDRGQLFKGFPDILRVTGEPDDEGEIGLFGHDGELTWHNNQPHKQYRKPFIWLYAERGSKGSKTYWTNQMLAYEGLSDEDKSFYDTLEIQFGDNRSYIDKGSAYEAWRVKKVEEELAKDIKHKLVVTNPYGQKGLNISPYQTHWITGMNPQEVITFTDKLLEHLTKPEYVYKHEWEDGDVVLGEQVTSCHKRDPFTGMSTRVLHRIAFSPDKIMPEGLNYIGYNGVLK